MHVRTRSGATPGRAPLGCEALEDRSLMAAPASLVARALSATEVRVDWADHSATETGFRVERSVDNHNYAEVGAVGADVTTFTDAGLTPGTMYFYRVRADGPGGPTGYSNWNYAAALNRVTAAAYPATSLVASKASWTADGRVRLDWEERFGDETGFEVLRSTDAANYTLVAALPPDTTSFTDAPPAPFGTAYHYRVRAVAGAVASQPIQLTAAVASTSMSGYLFPVGTTLSAAVAAPSNVQVTQLDTARARLTWADNSANETGFLVQRSYDGRHFETLSGGSVGADATEFVYATPHPDQPVWFRVAAAVAGGHSLPSETVAFAFAFDSALAAPSGLTAVRDAATNQVTLTWQDNSGGETGFAVENGYGRVATVGAGVTSVVLPASAHPGRRWRVQALGAGGASRYSDAFDEYRVPAPPYVAPPPAFTEAANPRSAPATAAGTAATGAVTVTVRNMGSFNQLLVTGTTGNDRITVSQSGNTITVVANGRPARHFTGPFGDVAVKGGNGNDTITVASSVTVRALLYGQAGNDALNFFGTNKAYLVAVGGGSDVVAGNGVNTSYWTDQAGVDTVHASRAEVLAGRVHRVTSFHNNVSKEPTGQNLSEAGMFLYDRPTGNLAARSLWGLGPSMLDVNQGFHQNCPSTGLFQAFAAQQPDRLEELAVDLGDGTYAVDYGEATGNTFARVDADFRANLLASPGPSGNIWWLVLEKVMSFGYRLAGPSATFSQAITAGGDDALYEEVRGHLAAGRVVTAGATGTVVGDVKVVAQSHVYAVVGVYRTAAGEPRFVVRNPYGTHFVYNSGPYDSDLGLVTLTAQQLRDNFTGLNAIDFRYPPAVTAGADRVATDADGDGFETVSLAAAVTHWRPTASATWSVNGETVAVGLDGTARLPVGEHTVVLLVTDDQGTVGRDEVVVRVAAPA